MDVPTSLWVGTGASKPCGSKVHLVYGEGRMGCPLVLFRVVRYVNKSSVSWCVLFFFYLDSYPLKSSDVTFFIDWLTLMGFSF